MGDAKKKLLNRINDIDKMLIELDFCEINEDSIQNSEPKIDISKLDVVDVLHSILN